MANRFIEELANKLQYFGGHQIVRDSLTGAQKPGVSALARLIEVNENTLKDYCKTGKISPDAERNLAKKFGFNTDWPEWVTGTREEFKKRYEKKPPQGSKKVRLKARYRPDKRIGNLKAHASLDLNIQQAGDGDIIPMSFTINCNIAPLNSIDMGVRHVFIETYSSSGEIMTLPREDRMVFVPRSDNPEIKLQVAGNRHAPAWLVEAGEGHLGYISVPFDNIEQLEEAGEDTAARKYFCPLGGVAEGDFVTLTMGVYLKDLIPLSDQELAGLEQEDLDSLAAMPAKGVVDGKGKAFVGNKKILATWLATHQVVAGGDGYGLLCSETVEFVDADEN